MGIISRKLAVLVLEDGSIFKGYSLGKIGIATGEICFNTGMTGYQEIYTDPSYFGQIIINTSSHIGNYGTVDNEQESNRPQINGVIINEYSETYSRFNSEESLEDYFIKNPYIDTTTAIFATIILIIFGAIAGYIPAKRAASIKPIVALRDE